MGQSFGNCPHYIQARHLAPGEWAVVGQAGHPGVLDEAARAMASGAGRAASGPEGEVDMSHRGGRPGFVRVRGDTLSVPDFRGNRYFNTLGNFLLDPRAALLVPDFATGDLLHLAGTVGVDWDAAGAVRGAERVWHLHVERAWRRRAALPWRWTFRDCAPTTARTGTWAEAA